MGLVAYEFLPDFCSMCGRIGHVDKQCDVRVEKGAVQQFTKSLRFIPERRRPDNSENRWSSGGRHRGIWSGTASGSKGSQDSCGGRWASLGSGSDAISWRKKDIGNERDEEEVLIPQASKTMQEGSGGTAKNLLQLRQDDQKTGLVKPLAVQEKLAVDDDEKKGKRNTFKHQPRERVGKGGGSMAGAIKRKKRLYSEGTHEEEAVKKMKVGDKELEEECSDMELNAELTDRLCGD